MRSTIRGVQIAELRSGSAVEATEEVLDPYDEFRQREFVGDAPRSVIVLSVDQAIDTDAGEEVVSARALSKPEILNPFVADLGQAPKTAT
jgi:hypothetical protein